MTSRVARIESMGQMAECRNSECCRGFRKKRRWQSYCSKKCKDRHAFLRLLAKRRMESIVSCPQCGKEYAVRVIPVDSKGVVVLENTS